MRLNKPFILKPVQRYMYCAQVNLPAYPLLNFHDNGISISFLLKNTDHGQYQFFELAKIFFTHLYTFCKTNVGICLCFVKEINKNLTSFANPGELWVFRPSLLTGNFVRKP